MYYVLAALGVSSALIAIMLFRINGILGTNLFEDESPNNNTITEDKIDISVTKVVQMIIVLLLFRFAYIDSFRLISGKTLSQCDSVAEFPNSAYMIACGYYNNNDNSVIIDRSVWFRNKFRKEPQI